MKKKFLTMMYLKSYDEIARVSNNHTYTSPKKKARYLWTLLFGLVSGDLNPIHINPFTSSSYKSRLGGLSRHGISTIAQAESFIFNIFSFTEPTEVLAKGYNSIRYMRPVNIGDTMVYTYTLLEKKVVEAKKYTECIWSIKGVNQKSEDVFVGTWVVIYSPVKKNLVTTHISAIPLLTPPMEVQDTPIMLLVCKLFGLIAACVIAYMFFWSWSK